MKNNLKALCIIFSVALNIAFIGAYVYSHSDLILRRQGQKTHLRPLYEELNLSRGQLERLGPIRDKFHDFAGRQGRKIKAARLELLDLLSRDNPDGEAIVAKQKMIQTLQWQMQTRVISHLLTESRIFMPAQRVKFFELIKKRIKTSQAPTPRWIRRTPPRQVGGHS